MVVFRGFGIGFFFHAGFSQWSDQLSWPDTGNRVAGQYAPCIVEARITKDFFQKGQSDLCFIAIFLIFIINKTN